MNWSLIIMPAPEELTMGYVPAILVGEAQRERRKATKGRETRRFLVSLFAAFGLMAGLGNLLADHAPEGQRRLAEINLPERKQTCRNCNVPDTHAHEAHQAS